MDKKSKIFFIVFSAAVLIAAAASFYKFFILKDYLLTIEMPCDPNIEKCQIHTCDPQENENCPVGDASGSSYYKLVEKKASEISL